MSRTSDRTYSHIRSMILSCELQPGVHNREKALAELCGVSRTPERDALWWLEAELFIRRNESQRSFAADWSLDDLEEAFQLRAMLKAHAVRRTAGTISWDEMARLRVYNLSIQQAIDETEPDIAKFLEHNRHFHSVILEASGSQRLAGKLAQVTEQPVMLRTARQYDFENLRRSHHEHDELLMAFDNRDGEWAAAVVTAHIRQAFHSIADAYSGNIEIHKTEEAA